MFGKRMIAMVPTVVLALGGVQTAAGQAEIDALVFWDVLSTNKTARACRDLGYTLTEARSSETEFIAFLNAQPWDFVGIELPWDLITQKETVAQLLEDHVAAGGRLLVNFNNLDEWPRLQTLLGVRVTRDIVNPEDMFPTNPKHYVWYRSTRMNANQVPWSDSGDELAPVADGVVVGLFDNGEPSMVLANAERTIVNGFDWETYGGSGGMAHDQVEFLMECRVDFDRTSGRGVLDIFDFLRFQSLFISRDARANMCFDASFDIFDFLVFQNSFVTGCN